MEELITMARKVQELLTLRGPLVDEMRARHLSWNQIVAATGWDRSSIRRWSRERETPEGTT